MKSEAYAHASGILLPLLRVLIAAGLTEEELLEICTRHAQHIRKTLGRHRLRSLDCHGPELELIVSQWINDPEFLNEGAPAALDYSGKRGFKSLVRRASPGFSPTEALRDLLKHRVVSISQKKQVRLLSRFFPCRSKNAIGMDSYARSAIDFLRTNEFNFLRNPKRGQGLFQRFAHNASIDPRLAPLFNRYARKQGEALLETVDDWLARREKRTGKGRTKNLRLGMGIYVINESLR